MAREGLLEIAACACTFNVQLSLRSGHSFQFQLCLCLAVHTLSPSHFNVQYSMPVGNVMTIVIRHGLKVDMHSCCVQYFVSAGNSKPLGASTHRCTAFGLKWVCPRSLHDDIHIDARAMCSNFSLRATTDILLHPSFLYLVLACLMMHHPGRSRPLIDSLRLNFLLMAVSCEL